MGVGDGVVGASRDDSFRDQVVVKSWYT
jgi:hypothetical protein